MTSGNLMEMRSIFDMKILSPLGKSRGGKRLLDGMVLRGDVEEWIAERNAAADRLQSQTLWWAKAAAWIAGLIGIVGIVVAVLIAVNNK